MKLHSDDYDGDSVIKKSFDLFMIYVQLGKGITENGILPIWRIIFCAFNNKEFKGVPFLEVNDVFKVKMI